jgi:hypothetical protein
MKFMLIMKSTKDSEAGVPPTAEQMTTMMTFHEEMMKAGVLLSAEGVHASSRGARVRFSGTKRTITDGPFAETKELIAGFWLIQAASKEEAIQWVKRFPNVWREETEIEIRQVAEAEDFGESFTPEVATQLDRIHDKAAANEAKHRAPSAGAR